MTELLPVERKTLIGSVDRKMLVECARDMDAQEMGELGVRELVTRRLEVLEAFKAGLQGKTSLRLPGDPEEISL